MTTTTHILSRASRRPRAGDGVRIRWYRSISFKLAMTLGLAMFSIQVLASSLILLSYQAALADADADLNTSPSEPFVRFLRRHLQPDASGAWRPDKEALAVLEEFLQPGETYLWLDPDDRVLMSGPLVNDLVQAGDVWSRCESREYCAVIDDDGETVGGSTWTEMAVDGDRIGTFVFVWLESQTSLVGRQAQVDVFSRLVASGILAALTSLLLVSLVTRRLTQLAEAASTPLATREEAELDLPGPFEVAGDDEISRLARALNTMRSRIEDLVASLAERDRQRREWIAQVSHDLRTPLTALSACLDRALERFSEADTPVDQQNLLDTLGVARQDTNRLQTLVDDLFELARLDANEDLVLEPVPPGELVRQTVRGLRPMAEAQSVELHAEVAPAMPTIRADGRRLMRALENLVRNAAHFARSRVDVVAECTNGFLCLEVRDDGPGLPVKDGLVILGQADNQPRRADSAGLGLIVTRRVVTAHGGRIEGSNRPEGGASVRLFIPIVEAH